MTHTREAGTGGSGFRASVRHRVAAHHSLTRFFRIHDRADPPSAVERLFGLGVLDDVSRPLFVEVLGALAVAESLSGLDEDWVVYNAVSVASREDEIDHVVIGPGGVFAVTIADHSDQSVRVAAGAIEVAGSRHNHIRNSEFEVGCVERLLGTALGLPVAATGVVVVIDPRSVTVSDEPRDVVVVSSRELVSWLQKQPMTLSAYDVDRLAAAADCPATWMNDSLPTDEGLHLHARFLDVVARTRAAQGIRRLWGVAAVTVVVSAFGLWAWSIMMLEEAAAAGGW